MSVRIGGREVGAGHPVYIVAELSANHGGSLPRALDLVAAVADCGVDAVKLQTYRPESLTIDSDAPPFRIGDGTAWAGQRLYDLYSEAQTPWEWHESLFAAAAAAGIDCFSTPFDLDAIELLERFDPPAYKVASFELTDLALIDAVARRGRPVLISTGMATIEEIDDAVRVATAAGAGGVVLLRCNSAYPAAPAEMDLRTIPDMAARWGVPIGLSDHTLSPNAALAAVGLGAVVLEKHVTQARADGGPDAGFSLEPAELRALVAAVRESEAACSGPCATGRRNRNGRASRSGARSMPCATSTPAQCSRRSRCGRSGPRVGCHPRSLTPFSVGPRASAIARGTPITRDLFD